MARSYTVHQYEAGGTRVDIKGDCGGWFRRMAILVPDYMDRSIRHAAYEAQTRLKIEFLQKAPGGQKFPDITILQRHRTLDAFKRHVNRYGRPDAQGRKRLKRVGHRAFISRGKGLAWGMGGTLWPAGGKLAQAMGYEHKKGTMRADIGWLSRSAARLGAAFQRGERNEVTKAMRGLFAAAGVYLGRKKELVTPPRPVMEPFFRNRSGWILQKIEDRLHHHMERDAARDLEKYARRTLRVATGRWVS